MVYTTILGDWAGNTKGLKPFTKHFLQRQLEDQLSCSLDNSTHMYTYNLKVEAANLKELLR
jgi:hypothetical protein